MAEITYIKLRPFRPLWLSDLDMLCPSPWEYVWQMKLAHERQMIHFAMIGGDDE